MTGDLKINGQDAYSRWGVSLDSTGLSALMTPAGVKPLVSNKSRLENGRRVVITGSAKTDERDVTLLMNMAAKDETTFFDNYAAFCGEVLSKGALTIETKYQAGVVYRMVYTSCAQFSEFMRGIAKFTLKLNEPDPTNRGEEAKPGTEDWENVMINS